MSKTHLFEQVAAKKIIPVVKLDRVSDAKPLGEALCKGGLPVAEVTFRTEAAEESIRIMRKEFPEMMVGAGTVLNVEQARRALDAGATFLVAPGFCRSVVEFAIDNHLDVYKRQGQSLLRAVFGLRNLLDGQRAILIYRCV